MAQLHADRAHMDFITLWGVIPLTDLFYAYTLAHVAAVPAGLWLVVTAIRRNRGRVWWRWWAAGLLLFLPVVALYPVLATGKFISEGYYNLGGLYLVLLSPSLWILGEPDRTA